MVDVVPITKNYGTIDFRDYINEADANYGVSLQRALDYASTRNITVIVPPPPTGFEWDVDTQQIDVEGSATLEMMPRVYLSSAAPIGVRIASSASRNKVRVNRKGLRWYNNNGDTTSIGCLVDKTTYNTENEVVANGWAFGLQVNEGTTIAETSTYHTFRNCSLQDNLTNMYLPGVSNQNTYIGGQCRHTSSSAAYAGPSDRINIWCEGNGNTFINESLEGKNNTEKSVFIDGGLYNYFIGCRFELGALIHLGVGSTQNLFVGGYGLLNHNQVIDPIVQDDSLGNQILGHAGTTSWSSSNVGQTDIRYAFSARTPSLSSNFAAIEVRNNCVAGTDGVLRTEIRQNGWIVMYDAGGQGWLLNPPSAAGPAVWAAAP